MTRYNNPRLLTPPREEEEVYPYRRVWLSIVIEIGVMLGITVALYVMIGYLNMGLGPEDAAARNPLKEYQAELGDPSTFTYGALRSMMIAYVPD